MDLTGYKSRDLITVECDNCNNNFQRTKHLIQKNLRTKSKLYCSLRCSGSSRNTKVTNYCKECNNIIVDAAIRNRSFCNKSCSATYNNKIKATINYCKNCQETTKRKTFCSNTCHTKYRYENYIERWKKNLESGVIGKDCISTHIRKYLFTKYSSKCMICSWSEIHPITGRIPLTVDHTDGNCFNNKENNLKLLCPNCHSLTPTYGSLNKGKGRKARYESR